MSEAWPRVSVGELVRTGEAHLQTGPFGTQLSASEYVPKGIPVINVRNVGFGDVRADDLEYVSEAKAEQLHHHILRAGDIVFGRKGAVERHALIDANQDGWVQGSDCLRLRLRSPSFNERFVSFYLRTQAHQDWMQALCSFGATMSSLNQDIVNRIQLPRPPRPIQDRIAAILAAYDDLIANNQRRIALLESMAEEIYREWFVRMRFPGVTKCNGVPSGWAIKPLGEIFRTSSGGTPSREDHANFEGEIPWVKTGELKKLFVTATEEHISERAIENSAANILPEKTVVMAMYCAMPDVTILGMPASTNQACCSLIPRSEAIGYAWTYFFAKYALIELLNFTHGAAQQNLSQQIIQRFKVLAPNEDLIEEFDDQAQPLLEQALLLQRQTDKLTKMRDALLPRLISGKLRIDHLDIQFPPSMKVDMPKAA